MSNRRSRNRAASRSYAARLQRRSTPRLRRGAPAWLTWRVVLAVLALAAEGGHLTAAVIEWPGAAARGVTQLLAAGALGVVAVGIYFGPDRVLLSIGLAVTVGIPGLWLVGTLVGIPPYRDYPPQAAVALAVGEVAAAVVLAARWRITRSRPADPPTAKPGRDQGRRPHRVPV